MAETYATMYELDIEALTGIEIDKEAFSFRTNKRLENAQIKTIFDLAMRTPEELMAIEGFGAGCQREVAQYMQSLKSKDRNDFEKKKSSIGLPRELIDKIFNGDFSIDLESISDKQSKLIKKCQNAYDFLEKDLIVACKEETKKVITIVECLNAFTYKSQKIDNLKKQINVNYLGCKVKHFISAFSVNSNTEKDLLALCVDDDETLDAYILDLKFNNIDDYALKIAYKFLAWCSFDVREEISNFKSIYEKNEREYQVLKERAKRKTLEQIGEQFEVTRERIRQIEKKGTRKFEIWQKKHRILLKIYAIRNGDDVLTPLELSEYFGDETELLTHLYRNNASGDITYDKQLDVFIVGDNNATDRVNEFIDSLPETFREDNYDEYIRQGVEEFDLSEELLVKAFSDSYRVTGNIYHRSKLTLTTLYYQVLKNCFPDGLHIYDTDEIKKFRQAAKEEYDIDITGSDRSIIAILFKVGILCERGTYKADEGIDLSNELAKKIEDYIDNSEHPVFMTNTIYSVFEKELLEEGVDNKYFLQGLLHKRFDGKWIFRRDYISKDESFTTVYASLVEFIKNSTYPVSKEDIYRAYPGITEIVINIATGDKDILNLFGVYIHSSKLNISAKEKMYLHKKTEEALEKENITHCKEVYENVMQDYPDLLINNYVNYSFSMYSLLEYLFGDEYSFSRPFIARKGVEITKANTVIQQMVSEADDIEIDTIQRFAKEHHIVIDNILDLVDSCNETHLLINDLELKRIEDIGITEDKVIIIEDILDNEINTTIPVAQLKCINQFPGINYDWNEWLIYSIIKKWSTRFEVATNSKYFKLSAPLISRIGEMDASKYDAMSKDDIGRIATADNLDDIDNLLLDIDFDELGGF